jgi:hypothetical protein
MGERFLSYLLWLATCFFILRAIHMLWTTQGGTDIMPIVGMFAAVRDGVVAFVLFLVGVLLLPTGK